MIGMIRIPEILQKLSVPEPSSLQQVASRFFVKGSRHAFGLFGVVACGVYR